jgi:hypothetical protein
MNVASQSASGRGPHSRPHPAARSIRRPRERRPPAIVHFTNKTIRLPANGDDRRWILTTHMKTVIASA